MYLGFKITQKEFKTDSEKIKRLLRLCPPLKNSKPVATFLGIVTGFSMLMLQFSELCKPIYALKMKRVKFVWAVFAQRLFELLKEVIKIECRAVISALNALR